MKTTALLLADLLLAAGSFAQNPRVGIGTTAPRAGLDVAHDDGLVATGEGPNQTTGADGPGNAANLPIGAGTRLLWLPAKAAFRAGEAVSTEWDYANIGLWSTAFGFNNTASGAGATAHGTGNTATGTSSVALGSQNTASGHGATALGFGTTASGEMATALGVFSAADGPYSLAAGYNVTASGESSVALGNEVSTNAKPGSFAFGDGLRNVGTLLSSADHEFSARFAGGYRLFTNAPQGRGLFLTPANRLGIGAAPPRAGLDLAHDDGLVATGQGPDGIGNPGPGNPANLPTGAGTRLLWLPAKAAFRAGEAVSTEWDYANIGLWSTAFGFSNTASGVAATALGSGATASGLASTALGNGVNATGLASTAIGNGLTASGEGATALGVGNLATGNRATALGAGGTASGDYSMALGSEITASGAYSTAMGRKASTNGKAGSFVVGDNSTSNLLLSSADHEFSARFAGGYRLFTNADMTVGVSLGAGANAWSTLSDSTKKEGFRPADGPAFLRKIAALRLGSWHYRGQDARTMRHYGPMAQDFFAAFGRDGVGTVGCDTLINQADFDGVNLIALQALVEKTDRLEAEKRRADERLVRLEAENADLRRLLGQLAADVQNLKATAPPAAAR